MSITTAGDESTEHADESRGELEPRRRRHARAGIRERFLDHVAMCGAIDDGARALGLWIGARMGDHGRTDCTVAAMAAAFRVDPRRIKARLRSLSLEDGCAGLLDTVGGGYRGHPAIRVAVIPSHDCTRTPGRRPGQERVRPDSTQSEAERVQQDSTQSAEPATLQPHPFNGHIDPEGCGHTAPHDARVTTATGKLRDHSGTAAGIQSPLMQSLPSPDPDDDAGDSPPIGASSQTTENRYRTGEDKHLPSPDTARNHSTRTRNIDQQQDRAARYREALAAVQTEADAVRLAQDQAAARRRDNLTRIAAAEERPPDPSTELEGSDPSATPAEAASVAAATSILARRRRARPAGGELAGAVRSPDAWAREMQRRRLEDAAP